MDSTILIQSAVVAAAISGILGVLQSVRSKADTYRSNERAAWRKELKDAIILLSTSGKCNPHSPDVDCALAHTRSHINPYGYSSAILSADPCKLSDKEYLHDAHIWAAIHTFEEKKDEKSLQALIHYINLLLKYDETYSQTEEKTNVFFFLVFSVK